MRKSTRVMTIIVPLVMFLAACTNSSDGDTGGTSSVSQSTQAESSAPGKEDTPTEDTPSGQPDGEHDDTTAGMIPASEALQQETTPVVEKYLEANYAGVGAKKLFDLPAEDQTMIQEARSDLEKFNALTDAEKTRILNIAEDIYDLSDTYVGVDQLSTEDKYALFCSINLIQGPLALAPEGSMGIIAEVARPELAKASGDGSTVVYPTDSIRLESHGKPAYVQDIVMRKVDGVWRFDPEKLLSYGQKYIRGESVYEDSAEDTPTPEKKLPIGE